MESTKSKDDCSRIVLPKDLTARLDFIENNEAYKRCFKEVEVALAIMKERHEVQEKEWKSKYEKRPYHKGSAQQQEYIDYAWDISKDPNFLYKMKAESGALSPTAQSKVVKNGIREPSWGFCQTHRGYHPHYYSNPDFWKNRFFTDWRYQMDECWKMYKGGTPMYARITPEIKKNFEWK